MSHHMNKALLLTSLAVLLALPATALAGTCGVLPFSASSDVNRGAAPNITALVSSELDIRGGYDLVIAADPEEFEGGDCGSSPACIKQFGQANKHEAVVAGSVTKSGDKAYTLTLKLHDGKSAGLIRTVQRDVPSSADALMDAVTAVVVELVTGQAPDEEEEGDGAAESEGPLFEDLDFDEMMDEADEEVTPNNRQRGRAAPRNPGRDRDRDEDSDEDDPFDMDELDALDLSAEEMEKKKRDRERQAELERERQAAEERAARERAAEERRRRVAEKRAREEEERERAERAERDRRARAERERREAAERERLERERREREEEERQARADRERRQREMEERAERDRARRDREEQERQARAEQARADREREEENARAERQRRDREEAEREEEERERRDRARADREERRSSSRDDDDDGYRRDRSRDEDMAARVERERERRRAPPRERAAREWGAAPVELAAPLALAPAPALMIGSAFDDDDGGFQIGPGDDDDDDDDYEYDGGITIGSAAADIEFGDDDDDDEPVEGMIISDAAEDENPGVRRRREAEAADGDRYARARNFRSSSSSDRDDEDEDDDELDDYRRDDEDDDGDSYSSDRSSSRERSDRRSSRSYDRDERVASRDDSYLTDDYDEYDLDADSYSAARRTSSRSNVSRSTTTSGNRPWFSARVSGGYTNYYLHFAQYGFDLSVFPAPRASVDVQVDFWTLSIRECPECEQEFRTLPSFYLGGSYRFTNLKIVQPYVGGDVGAVVYAIGTLDDGSGVIERRPLMGAAFEVKGGVDIMFTRHFGIGAGLKAGVAYAPKIKENVHPDWNPLQFLLNARIAAVVQF